MGEKYSISGVFLRVHVTNLPSVYSQNKLCIKLNLLYSLHHGNLPKEKKKTSGHNNSKNLSQPCSFKPELMYMNYSNSESMWKRKCILPPAIEY